MATSKSPENSETDTVIQHKTNGEFDTEKRIRTLTKKELLLVNARIDNYQEQLHVLHNKINDHIHQLDSVSREERSVKIELLKDSFSRFINESGEFAQYLQHQRTKETLETLAVHNQVVNEVKMKVAEKLLKNGEYETENKTMKTETEPNKEDEKQEIIETLSQKQSEDKPKSRKSQSEKSKTSKKSKSRKSGSTTLSEKRAKAESARVKLQYANKEAELLKQKAAIESDRMLKTAEIDAKD